MTADTEIDVDALRTELDRIQDAMGIDERYPGQFRLWPVWGALVLAAALVSQYVHSQGLPEYLYAVAWFGFVGGGWLYQWYRTDYDDRAVGDDKPDVWLQVASIFALYGVYVAVLGPAMDALPDDEASILVFALVVALVGVAYLVLGNTLKAYYIRRRDRWAFYVGGAWMLAFAALAPNVAALREWGYAVYGVLFAAHSMASYAVLSRAD